MKRDNGFILLEVLMAISVLMGGIVVLYSAFSKSIQLSELSHDYYQATLLLESRIWDVEHFKGNSYPIDPSQPLLQEEDWVIHQHPLSNPEYEEWNVGLNWKSRSRSENLSLMTIRRVSGGEE